LIKAAIERDRAELTGNFCRGCGYCMPCPADIPLNFATRMVDVLNRLPAEGYLTDEWNEKMSRIENCTECGQCKPKCPYNLEIPELVKKNLVGYRKIYEERCNSR